MFFKNRHSKNFRRTAWLAVLAVLLQILVPLVHHPAQAQTYNANEEMHHCGMHGNMPAAPVDRDNKAPASKQLPCPICQSLNLLHSGFVPPNLIALVTLTDIRQIYELPEVSFIRGRLLVTGQPRAPPTPA